MTTINGKGRIEKFLKPKIIENLLWNHQYANKSHKYTHTCTHAHMHLHVCMPTYSYLLSFNDESYDMMTYKMNDMAEGEEDK